MIPHRDFAEVNRLLASVIELGMPLESGLEFVRAQSRSSKAREALAAVQNRLREGLPLADALRAEPDAFPADYCAMVEVGARSGALPGLLRGAESYYRLRHRLDRGLRRLQIMLLIGMLLCGTALFVLSFISRTLKGVYDGVDVPVPDITFAIFWLGEHALVLFGVIVAGAVAAAAGAGQLGRLISVSRFVYTIPFWGGVQRNRDLSLMCTTMGLRLRAGAPLVKALSDAASTLANRHARASVERIRARVEQGEELSSAMFYERFIPRALAWAVSLGESRNEVPEVFQTFAEVYTEQLERAFDVAVLLLSPLSIIAAAHAVLVVAAAVFLPMLGLLQSIGSGRPAGSAGVFASLLPVALIDLLVFTAIGVAYFFVTRRRLRLTLFVDHLAAMARRNLPLQTGLRMVAQDEGGLFGTRIEHVARLMESGASPADAFAACPHAFPPIIRNLVRLGERSGNLAAFLQELRTSYRRIVQFQYESTYVLLYPVLLSLFISGMLSGLFVAFVPRLQEVFDSVGIAPQSSRWGLLMAANQVLLVLSLALAGVVIFVSLPSHTGYSPLRFARRVLDRIALALPGLRRMSLESSLRQVAVGIGLFLKAGATLPEAVRAAAELDINTALVARLGDLARHLDEGGRLSDWCRAERLLPADFTWFVEAGEAGGALPDQMLQAAEHYETRVRFARHVATRTVIPVFVLMAGALVLGACYFTFEPMVQLMQRVELL